MLIFLDDTTALKEMKELKMAKTRFCDGHCNECPLMKEHPANRELAFILNKLVLIYGDEIIQEINEECPNLTCCPDCHIDDFCHVEGCEIMAAEEV